MQFFVDDTTFFIDFTIMFEMDGKMVNNYICYGDDKQWPLELASGMEKFISSLAIRIALTNIASLPRPNFMAIDEGWGTMDSDNLNSLYQLFQYLKNIFQFSLIISGLVNLLAKLNVPVQGLLKPLSFLN